MTKDQQTRENIIRLRKEANITQDKLADAIGVNRSTYRNLESGSTRLVNPHIDEIAAALKVSAEKLLGYDLSEIRTSHFADIETAYEKEIVTLNSEIDFLKKENERLAAENGKLNSDNSFLKEMNSWLRNELDKRDKNKS